MVLKFTSNVVDPPANILMGKDIWGWPEDVWFHVDQCPSAHVYLRLPPGQTIDDIPEVLLQDCGQLCKANSRIANKLKNVDIVYTMWSNLKKGKKMSPGMVGFHDYSKVKKFCVGKRMNPILNRLKKTRIIDDDVNFQAEREARDMKEQCKYGTRYDKKKFGCCTII